MKSTDALRKAQRNYTKRLYGQGYQRANIWMPGSLLESLKNKASREGLSLQKFLVLSLEKLVKNEEI